MAVAEGVFPAFKLLLATGQVNWDTCDLRAVLVNEDVDAPDLAADVYLSAVSSLARSNPTTVTGKVAAVDGLDCELDHSPIVFEALSATTDNGYDGLLMYLFNASDDAATMAVYLRKVASGGSVTNLPVQPTGTDITFSSDDYVLRI